MKRLTLNTASAGLGGALVIGALLAGTGIATAQSNEQPELTPTTIVEEVTTTTLSEPSSTTPLSAGDFFFGAGDFSFDAKHLNDAVTNGRLTQEQADHISEMITSFKDGTANFKAEQFNGLDSLEGFTFDMFDKENFDFADLEGFSFNHSGLGFFGTGETPWGDGAPPWATEAEED